MRPAVTAAPGTRRFRIQTFWNVRAHEVRVDAANVCLGTRRASTETPIRRPANCAKAARTVQSSNRGADCICRRAMQNDGRSLLLRARRPHITLTLHGRVMSKTAPSRGPAARPKLRPNANRATMPLSNAAGSTTVDVGASGQEGGRSLEGARVPSRRVVCGGCSIYATLLGGRREKRRADSRAFRRRWSTVHQNPIGVVGRRPGALPPSVRVRSIARHPTPGEPLVTATTAGIRTRR